MTVTRRAVVLLPAVTALTMTPSPANATMPLRGSGRASRQARSPGAFSSVGVDGPFRVVLRPGARDAIEIEADDNLLEAIETSRRGDGASRRLRIAVAEGVRLDPVTPIVVRVDFIRLGAVGLAGAGSIESSGLRGPRLAVSLGGSGKIALTEVDVEAAEASVGGSGTLALSGRAQRLALTIGGSGRGHAEKLVADTVAVTVGGSGEARVRAERSLAVTIAGSGAVWHAGAATPQTTIVGTGTVRRSS